MKLTITSTISSMAEQLILWHLLRAMRKEELSATLVNNVLQYYNGKTAISRKSWVNT